MGEYLENKISEMTRSELIKFILYAENRYHYRMTEALHGYEHSKAVEHSKTMKAQKELYEKWMVAKKKRFSFEERMKAKYHLDEDAFIGWANISEEERSTYNALWAKERELMDRCLNREY